MKAIIISIGNEITSGHTVNTNAAWMARELEPYGITPDKVVAIRDDLKSLISEIGSAVKKYELALVTGGLGPTHDDITKPALVKVFKTKLVRDKKILAMVKRYFRERTTKPMPPINLAQADIPMGCEALANRWGTAPGLCFETKRGLLFALPGVPYEMKNLMAKEVLPRIKKRFKKDSAIARKIVHTAGIGESTLYTMIEAGGGVEEGIELAYLPHMGNVDLRFTAKGETQARARQRLNRAVKKLIMVARPYCYGVDEETLEKVVGDILARKGLTLASAESCTGGRFASRITSVSGSSRYFLEGVVTYNNNAKMKRLNVREDSLIQSGAVSARVAREMARGVWKSAGADIGISSTGIAGPSGGTKEKPVGLVFIGLCIDGDARTKELRLTEDRERNQMLTTQAMLTWLWKEITT
ncbi:ADP-ribose pyrophosphatase of COG1058 family / Nicotinamide-nucleotide amidase [hydrothermal vent metagenome]|uniref:ADP-ribose pyrophosphatase of COG1058 family / Nicotinamide-nucleotide amidase n=1 Tax=hydrothermal vent metagenome TaxID=652676 RepID=A0A3B1C9F9_9ZZZZ